MNKSPLAEHWVYGEKKWVPWLSGRFRHRQHINLSEADALLLGLRGITRDVSVHGHRLLVFNDSQVVVGAVAKGRSSSRALLRKVNRINALVLVTRLDLGLRYIRSADNAADEPSRRRARRFR